MALVVSDQLNTTSSDLLVDLTCSLYDKVRMSFGKCRQLGGLDHVAFQRSLGEWGIYIKYNVDNLEVDLRNLEVSWLIPKAPLFMRIVIVFTVWFCCYFYSGTAGAQNNSSLTVLRAKGLVDVRKGTLLDAPIIYIRNGKIERVGSRLPIPDSATVVNLPNMYLMPGLVDAHTHLCHEYLYELEAVPGANTIAETVLLTEGDRALLGAKHAREMLLAGFTSARDLGNSGMTAAVALRDAINKGWTTGPRLYVSTRALAPTGGQFARMTPEVQAAIIPKEYVEVNGVAEARKAVRQAIYDGADLIKVIVNNGKVVLSLEELEAIVDEANRAGLKVAAHATNGDDPAMLAATAGVNSIEHGYTISTEVLKVMAAKDVYLVPTDRPGVERYQQRIQRALAAGVKIAIGSDLYYRNDELNRGQLSATTYKSYVAAGMSSVQVLQSLTMHPGVLTAGEGKVGLLEEGYFADVIGCRQNPLTDLKALEGVAFVMKGGVVQLIE